MTKGRMYGNDVALAEIFHKVSKAALWDALVECALQLGECESLDNPTPAEIEKAVRDALQPVLRAREDAPLKFKPGGV